MRAQNGSQALAPGLRGTFAWPPVRSTLFLVADLKTRIALLRRVDGIFALHIEHDATNEEQPYREVLRPPSRALEGHRELLDAWQSLAKVREIEPPVLEAVRLVLFCTVLDPEGERPTLPRLEIATPPAPHIATAANPRAYQGTKDRPPKPKRPAPRDLRPFLCVPGGQDRLVQLLISELGEVSLPSEERNVPPGYRRGLAWAAHLTPELLLGALAVHHELDCERDVMLRRCVGLFARGLFNPVIAWLRTAVGIAPCQRVKFLQLVEATAAKSQDPQPFVAQLTGIAAGCSDDNFELRMRYALTVIGELDDLAETAYAFDLAELHQPNADFMSTFRDHGYDSPPELEEQAQLRLFLDTYLSEPTNLAIHLWQACSIDVTLADELAFIAAAKLDQEAAKALAQTLADAIVYDECNHQYWGVWRQPLRRFVTSLREVPFQKKAVYLLEELMWEGTLGHIASITKLAPIACAEPLAQESWIALPLEGFGQVPTAIHEELLRAPMHSYAVLDKECLRKTDACLISRGIDSWIRLFPERFAAAFAQHPRTLCRTSHTLGQLAPPLRDAIVQQVMASQLAQPIDDVSATALVARLDRSGPTTNTSPVPKKLRQHIAGDLQLSDAQLERAAQIIRAAWPATMVEQAQELAVAHMARNLSTNEVDLATLDDQMLHALKLQSRLITNQRALRRLLRACHRGDDDYLLRHPISQAWLHEHQSIRERWLEGVTRTCELEGHGVVTLAIENRPLEALRMGTHVGSCYGLGGSNMWAAASIVLDINKQVVFARTSKGRFVARQVMVITDDNKLACYEVYPDTNDAMRTVFADYDIALAAHLGVEIETKTVNARLLLAQDWWDDYVWNPYDPTEDDDPTEGD